MKPNRPLTSTCNEGIVDGKYRLFEHPEESYSNFIPFYPDRFLQASDLDLNRVRMVFLSWLDDRGYVTRKEIETDLNYLQGRYVTKLEVSTFSDTFQETLGGTQL